MAFVKGSYNRTIKVPGLHIEPLYDLPGLRQRAKGQQERRNTDAVLPLTSLIDMFSMLVIFLLMNFSATGEILFMKKDITIPEASHARAIENAPVVSVSRNGVVFDVKKADGNQAEGFEGNFSQLRVLLQQEKDFHQMLRPNEEFKGQVNVQADQEIPLYYIKKVMNVLISEGWTGINFAVRSSGKSRGIATEDEAYIDDE